VTFRRDALKFAEGGHVGLAGRASSPRTTPPNDGKMHCYRWAVLSHLQESHSQEGQLCCPTSLSQHPAMAIDLEMPAPTAAARCGVCSATNPWLDSSGDGGSTLGRSGSSRRGRCNRRSAQIAFATSGREPPPSPSTHRAPDAPLSKETASPERDLHTSSDPAHALQRLGKVTAGQSDEMAQRPMTIG